MTEKEKLNFKEQWNAIKGSKNSKYCFITDGGKKIVVPPENVIKVSEMMFECLLQEFIDQFLRKWTEEYNDKLPELFDINIRLDSMKNVHVKDKYSEVINKVYDDNFKPLFINQTVYVDNILEQKAAE